MPVYDGRFRAVPLAVVIADIRAQVAAGAQHITFGDPDFFNGPGHALRVVEAVAREFPGVSYDVTINFVEVVRHCQSIGLALSPTFVAFTPWTTLDGYCDQLREIERLGLVAAISPIQYAIRLLIPQGSRMLELEAVRARVGRFDPTSLTHIWQHADHRVDALQQQLEELVGSRLNAPRDGVFARVWDVAHAAAGVRPPAREPLRARAAVPYLNEPWYC